MNTKITGKIDIGFFLICIIAIVVFAMFYKTIWNDDTTTKTDEEIAVITMPYGQTRLEPVTVDDKNTLSEQDVEKMPLNLQPETADPVEKVEVIVNQGEQIAKKSCFSCHQHGLLNAPVIGDGEEWEKRYTKGFEQLLTNALSGFNNMPARGGNPDLGDNEIEQALLYMLSQSGIAVSGRTPTLASESDNAVEKQITKTVVQETSDVAVSDIKDDPGFLTDGEQPPLTKETDAIADNQTGISEAKPDSIDSPGKDIYMDNCSSCHNNGIGGAPVTGEQNAWIQAFSKGINTLTEQVKQGPPAHPDITDKEIMENQLTEAINYIMEQTFWPGTN